MCWMTDENGQMMPTPQTGSQRVVKPCEYVRAMRKAITNLLPIASPTTEHTLQVLDQVMVDTQRIIGEGSAPVPYWCEHIKFADIGNVCAWEYVRRTARIDDCDKFCPECGARRP